MKFILFLAFILVGCVSSKPAYSPGIVWGEELFTKMTLLCMKELGAPAVNCVCTTSLLENQEFQGKELIAEDFKQAAAACDALPVEDEENAEDMVKL